MANFLIINKETWEDICDVTREKSFTSAQMTAQECLSTLRTVVPYVDPKVGIDDSVVDLYTGQAVYVFPTKDKDGNNLPAQLSISAYIFYGLLGMYEKIVFPAYFTSVTIVNYSDGINADNWGQSVGHIARLCKEIEFNGTSFVINGGQSNKDVFRYIPAIEKLNMPNLLGGWDTQGLYINPISTKLQYIMPKITTWEPYQIGLSGHMIDITGSDISAATTIGQATGTPTVNKWAKGVLVAPQATTMRMFRIPESDTFELRTPRLTSQTVAQAFSDGGNGTFKWCIGPNLTSLSAASYIRTYSQYMDIHIPAGLDPTTPGNTAYTLSQASISYSEDYNYTEDL